MGSRCGQECNQNGSSMPDAVMRETIGDRQASACRYKIAIPGGSRRYARRTHFRPRGRVSGAAAEFANFTGIGVFVLRNPCTLPAGALSAPVLLNPVSRADMFVDTFVPWGRPHAVEGFVGIGATGECH